MQTSTFSYDPQRHSSTLRQLIEINISLHPQHEQTSNSVFYWPSTQANVYFPASPCRNILLPFWTGTAGACISLHGQRLTPATSAADWLDGVGHSLNSARVAASHTVWMHTEVSQRINKEPGLKIYKIWLASPFACHVFRYYETISEVLSSVRKMEESLKRLKQARKGATTTSSAGANGGPTDDSKIRLQLALDVEYLGEQVGGVETCRQTASRFCYKQHHLTSDYFLLHCSVLLCVSDPEDGSSAKWHLHVLLSDGPCERGPRARRTEPVRSDILHSSRPLQDLWRIKVRSPESWSGKS